MRHIHRCIRFSSTLLLVSFVFISYGCGDAATLPADVPAPVADVPAADATAEVAPPSGDVAGDSGATPTDLGAVDTGVEDTQPADEPFSFFVTSLEAMQLLSGSQDGFGGDLGGLAGADAICQQIAATVDGGHKTWRAFLSATDGGDGNPVHAVDRIGDGPWYDRNGRLVALNKADLLNPRPIGDAQTVDDLPNEYGQGQKQFGDNHDTLTGSNAQGMLQNTDPTTTCQDWTSAVGPGSEKKVMGEHSWPRENNNDGGAPKIPPPILNACKGKAEGETCKVDKGKFKFEGTCEPTAEGSKDLGCLENGETEFASGGGGGGGDATSWIMAHTVPGCAPGVQLLQQGGGKDTDTVGGGGGYGGLYCFALEP